MNEYIERAAAMESILGLTIVDPAVVQYANAVCYHLQNLPAADVAPVVHGRWEQIKEWATKAKYRCSVCGREIMSAVKVNIEKYPYCHCGAKMDLEG